MQLALENPSTGHLTSAPALVSSLPSTKALVSESDMLMVSSGAALEHDLLLERLQETGVLLTPDLAVHKSKMQNWNFLFRVLFLQPSGQSSTVALLTSLEAARIHRLTCWSRQDSGLFDASAIRENTSSSQLLVGALHHAADISKP